MTPLRRDWFERAEPRRWRRFDLLPRGLTGTDGGELASEEGVWKRVEVELELELGRGGRKSWLLLWKRFTGGDLYVQAHTAHLKVLTRFERVARMGRKRLTAA